MSLYTQTIKGIEALDAIAEITPAIRAAIPKALNKTIDRTRTRAARLIGEQVAFPPGYLSPAGKRLYVSRYASQSLPEAVILARFRPTSLARFATTKDVKASRKKGVNVAIKPGSSKLVKGAFLVRLRKGLELTDTANNLGLAIRLKPGERLRSPTKRKALPFSKSEPGLALLYGPSVEQAFAGRDGLKGVRDEVTPDALVFLEAEFLRLVRL